MKVVVIDAREAQLERVGVAVYCKNLISYYDKHQHNKIKYILLASKDMKELNDIVNTEIIYEAPSSDASLITKLKWYNRLPKILKNLNADVYFGPLLQLPFINKISCSKIFTIHDAAFINSPDLVGNKLKYYISKLFFKNMIDNLDGIVCISNYAKKEFSELFGENIELKSRVIHHGVPDEILVEYKETKENEDKVLKKYDLNSKYFITIGTVYHKKNIIRLIDAFSKLDDKNINLVICGAPGFNSKEIFESPKQFNVEDRVYFLGRVETSDIRILLNNALSFVFPSLYEGFGIPILEAYSMGVPVTCSNSTCLPEIAGEGALFFDPFSVKDMTKKMNLIINDEELRLDLISKGKIEVSKFSWEQSARLHEEFFIDLLKDKINE